MQSHQQICLLLSNSCKGNSWRSCSLRNVQEVYSAKDGCISNMREREREREREGEGLVVGWGVRNWDIKWKHMLVFSGGTNLLLFKYLHVCAYTCLHTVTHMLSLSLSLSFFLFSFSYSFLHTHTHIHKHRYIYIYIYIYIGRRKGSW